MEVARLDEKRKSAEREMEDAEERIAGLRAGHRDVGWFKSLFKRGERAERADREGRISVEERKAGAAALRVVESNGREADIRKEVREWLQRDGESAVRGTWAIEEIDRRGLEPSGGADRGRAAAPAAEQAAEQAPEAPGIDFAG